jgi:hypothetical protein
VGQTPDIKVRPVLQSDYPQILRISREVISKAFPEEVFKEDKIKEVFNRARDTDGFYGIVLEIDKVIRGILFLSISEIFYIQKKFCLCLAIFVEEKYRRYSMTLFNAMEFISRQEQVSFISVHRMVGLSPKGMDRLLNRLGFKEKEIGYWKEL